MDKHSEIFFPESPLENNVRIVVQNICMGEWLIRQLTLKQGVIMGPNIMMPEQSLRYFAEGFDSVRKHITRDGEENVINGVLYLDSLKLIIYKALKKVLKTDEPEYASLRTYVGRRGAERLWPLADSVAGIFYYYGMNCPALLEEWEKNRLSSQPSSPKHGEEVWQFRLWKYIFEKMEYIHLSRLLSSVIDKDEKYQGPLCRIILFGSMFLGETGLKFFHHLSQQMDVHHFVLSPSKAFTVSGYPKTGRYASQDKKLPHFLENNCRLFEGFNRIISKLKIQNVNFAWESPQTAKSLLLHKLQKSLLEGSEMDPEWSNDGSLEIHQISGGRRTVEVLKDRILQALRDDPSLRPTDIGILAPDINLYAPHIEVIFPMGKPAERLEYNLIDLPAISNSSCQLAFRQIMELPGSRFGRDSLLALFENPYFEPRLHQPELGQKLREIVDNLNIRWGLDREHRIEDGVFHGLSGSWEQGFNRILAGHFYSEDDLPELKPSPGESNTTQTGIIIQVLRELDNDFRQLHLCSMTLREWILAWERKTEKWLASKPAELVWNSQGRNGRNTGKTGPRNLTNDDRDRMNIKTMFRNLMSLDNQVKELSTFEDKTLPWTVFKSLLEAHLNSFNGHRGRYLTRGITGSSLKPMRAIPFRRIYLLGMDEGAWPGQETLPDFDLRDSVTRLIDLSRESVDRFAFVETILSAEEHLSFFTSGQEATGTDIIPPASSLIELLDYAGKETEKLVYTHPLSSCDARAFTGKGRMATCSSRAFTLAQALTGKDDTERQSGNTSISQKIPASGIIVPEISWQEIEVFLKNPVAYFFSRRLGLSLADKEEGLSEDDPLEPDFPDWWLFCRKAVVREPELLNNPDDFLGHFSRKLQLESRVADIPLSKISLEIRREEVALLVEGINSLRKIGLDIERVFSCRLLKTLLPGSPAIEQGPVEFRHENRESSGQPNYRMVNMQAPQFTPASGKYSNDRWILGTIPGLHRMKDGYQNGRETWCMIEYTSSTHLRNKIKGWLAALLIGSTVNRSLAGTTRSEIMQGDDSMTLWRLPDELCVYSAGMGKDFPFRCYRYRTAPPPVGDSGPVSEDTGSIVDMNKAFTLLNEILDIMQQAETEPLCLYPVLADLMLQTEDIEEISRKPEDLANLAGECWNKLLRAPRSVKGSYYFTNCPYREAYLKEPNFHSPVFYQAWKLIYLQGGLA